VKTLVLGGYGAVGARVCATLRAAGHDAIAAGRDPVRADRVVDLRDERAYRRALSDVAVVVNASGTEDPSLVEIAARRGVAFVDITATMDYIRAVEALDPPAPVLLSVGLAPGLTNLLAAAVHVRAPGPIDIALLLGSGERHGAAGTDWAYHLLGRQFTDTATSRPIRNYTQSRVFQLPGGGSRRLYRADYSDQHVLTRDLKAPVRTYFGLDSRIATLALALMTWVPTASQAARRLHVPGTDHWIALAVGSDGTTRWAEGDGQSQATATMTASAVQLVAVLSPGVHHLHEVMALADIRPEGGIRIGLDAHDA